jgi:hypothetical protein
MPPLMRRRQRSSRFRLFIFAIRRCLPPSRHFDQPFRRRLMPLAFISLALFHCHFTLIFAAIACRLISPYFRRHFIAAIIGAFAAMARLFFAAAMPPAEPTLSAAAHRRRCCAFNSCRRCHGDAILPPIALTFTPLSPIIFAFAIDAAADSLPAARLSAIFATLIAAIIFFTLIIISPFSPPCHFAFFQHFD